MRKTPENLTKKRVKEILAGASPHIPQKLVWNAGASFGEATVDCTGVIAGIAVAIEVKRMDKKATLTGRQLLFLKEWTAAGGISFVIASEADLTEFKAWLLRLKFYKASQ